VIREVDDSQVQTQLVAPGKEVTARALYEDDDAIIHTIYNKLNKGNVFKDH
tara:strand:+ start:349 stop:501 length:153 start_codon:yes stop_codon:yes gene_type:complete